MFVKEITKRYDGKAVVDGVSFEIPKGKVLSLIGPNGAGKSTVMGMLSRLIARDSGLVDFEGTEITRWKSRELSKRLAILTQANNVQMKLTVRELVAFGRFPYSGGRLTQEDNEIIDRAIAYMELGDFEEQFIDEHLAECGVSVGIGVGGSFDVLSGRVERAPEIFIRLKLEWLYRIASDRKRWKRALALPRFVLKVLRQRFVKR